MIKRRNPSKFWIALWSDPVAYSPYANKAGDFKNLTENAKKDYEIEIFKKADLLVFTNYHQMVYMLGKDINKYKEKSIIITHGFDPDFYSGEIEHPSNEKIVFAYIGHLDKNRTIIELANGLKDSKFKNMFKVKIIGHLPQDQVDYLIKNDLMEIFEVQGSLSWHESLREMQKCDFLLSMDPNYLNMDYSQQMGSKIADYLGSMKPILFLSYDKGISADIAKSTGNKIIRNNAQEIAKFLDRVAVFGLWKPKFEKYQQFNSRNISRTFDSEISKRLRK